MVSGVTKRPLEPFLRRNSKFKAFTSYLDGVKLSTHSFEVLSLPEIHGAH